VPDALAQHWARLVKLQSLRPSRSLMQYEPPQALAALAGSVANAAAAIAPQATANMALCLIAHPCDPVDRSSRITGVAATQFAAIAENPLRSAQPLRG
jgi:hypothetical protein